MKHYTIPIFVPELACPNQCIFCNQRSISGCQQQPEPDEVHEIIQRHLKTIPDVNAHVEIGFFGGSFTGIETALQEKYLAVANEYITPAWSTLVGYSRLGDKKIFFQFIHNKHQKSAEVKSQCSDETKIARHIQGIRLSTRPDYIDIKVLKRLKCYGVTTIELGAQSLDDEVLLLSGRGHTVADVERAASMILDSGFALGLQMMTGLPGDTPEKSQQTARRIVELGATCTRIYPTLVIRGTELEQRWRKGDYQPQSLREAVELCADLLDIFSLGGVKVIRVGLHPSEGILDGSELLAGPFHPSFRELVKTYKWEQKLLPLKQQHPDGGNITIPVTKNELPYAIGYDSANRNMLEKHFRKVEFSVIRANTGLPLIITDKRTPLPVKNALKKIGNTVFIPAQDLVYKSINGHPDIFMCEGAEGLVVAPGLPEAIKGKLMTTGIRIYTGNINPGKTYPDSAIYNAVVTSEYIIHNLKITDTAILEAFPGRKHLHVNQGYTRCNLIALGTNYFITSDKGIEKVLLGEGKQVLFVDPRPVRLHGQEHGFFPGCCGILNNKLLISGSLVHHPDQAIIVSFINEAGLVMHELFPGDLTDVGGIFTIDLKNAT
jgi:hypothetical protein